MDKFDGNPLEWPEWSRQFLATVDGSGAQDSQKMQYLKTLVTGKHKAAIDGMGYSGQMYHVSWQTLEHDFGRPELVVKAQLRKIHAYSFIKPHDSLENAKFSQVVSGCVKVLTQFGYEMDIGWESVLNSAVRKLPKNVKNKWLTFLQRCDASHKKMRVFSACLKNIAKVQENKRLQFGSAIDKARTNLTRDKTKSTNFAATRDSSSLAKTQCPLKDGEHKIWQCEMFKKLKLVERQETMKKCNLCFSCLSAFHRISQCKANRTFGKDGCSKRHNRLQHSDDNKPEMQKKQKRNDETTNNADAVLTANSCSGSLQVVPVILSSGTTSTETMAICDTGSTLSFVDKSIRDQLDAQGNALTLIIAGIGWKKEMISEKVRIKVKTPNVSESVTFHFHPSRYLGSILYNYNDLKRKYSFLDLLPDDNMNLKNVILVLGHDNYHLLFPVEYKKGKRNEPWAVKTKLGWTLSGPLPKHEVAQVAANCDVAAEDDGLGAQIKSWFSMESYATRVNVSGRSKDDSRSLEQLEKTTKSVDGRCQVRLAWAEEKAMIQNNYFSAQSLFCSLERRLEKDESPKQRYETINMDVQNGYVQKLEESELDETKDERQWYVLHHPVINPHKLGKVRRVCNAAAKYKWESLNDTLLTGADLVQNLVGIIFRFREHQFALAADIEAMFLQVKVAPQKWRVLRFLWRSRPEDKFGVSSLSVESRRKEFFKENHFVLLLHLSCFLSELIFYLIYFFNVNLTYPVLLKRFSSYLILS